MSLNYPASFFLFKLFLSFSIDISGDIRPFELDFGSTVSMIVSPDYLLDSSEFDFSEMVPEKRRQPRRAAKASKPTKSSKAKKSSTKPESTSKDKTADTLPRKVIIHKGNKFYCDSQSDRKLIWKCSTSRFTNCTAQLTTNLNCNKIVAAGEHDHADNTE